MDLCRAKGVISFEGPLGKMLFGPPPSKAPKKAVPGEDNARTGERRAYYENLLGRANITDAELEQLP